MRKNYRTWNSIPSDLREKIMKVVFANKINFNETLFRCAQSDVWYYAEGKDNGRLKIGDETYQYIDRVPNVDCYAVYISIDYYEDGSTTLYYQLWERKY